MLYQDSYASGCPDVAVKVLAGTIEIEDLSKSGKLASKIT
jgi:hypothetical protein